jgi:penicillin-binding protein 1C
MISPILKKMVILSEDRHFLDHSGVDWTAVVWATARNLVGEKKRGASTISMQLASILDLNLMPERRRRSFSQKIKQMHGSLALEKVWTKNEILEAYLNLISFRGELQGITAAAFGLFGKAPHGLDIAESAILASLIRSPSASVDDVKKRACRLSQGVQSDFSCDQIEERLKNSQLQPYFIHQEVAHAPHLARKLLLDSEVTTTLDLEVQKLVSDVLQRQVLAVKEKNVHDAAALVVDNATGEVLAYVGGVGSLGSAPYVDGVRAKRQAGSTLKPFLYGIAMDRRYLTASSRLEDSPVDIPVVGGVYHPQNYDREFHGDQITLREALASSLNVPAVKALTLIGVDTFVSFLQTLGFEQLKRPDFYGPSLALGAVDVSLWDLVNAYRSLARQGVWSPLRLNLNVPSEKAVHRVFSSETSFIVSDILADRESRSLTFGLENPLALNFWAAVKTGTSKDMRDNWCIGYSEKYTVGVWVGNFSGQPMWNVTGATGAAPAWSDIMKRLHQKKPGRTPTPPKNVVQNSAAGYREWYIAGTEPSSVAELKYLNRIENNSKDSFAKITYPADGTIIARDPDIPLESQRVFFSSNASHQTLSWVLNGKHLAKDETGVSWSPPDAGSYHLSLVNSEGKVLDTVYFVVR